MQEVVALLIGFFVGVFIHLKISSKKHKKFVCGHCDSKDTLQMRKIKDNDVFICSFCNRVLDEDLLKLMYKEDYELLKKSRLDGNDDGVTGEKDN